VFQSFVNLQPLIKLTEASKKISQGQFDVNIISKGNDEIGILADSFKKMAADLRMIETRKEEFLSMIRHEMKNSLVPIKSYADMLLSKEMGSLNSEQKDKIRIIKASTESLQKYITDMSDSQKLDIGMLSMNLEEGHIGDVVNVTISKLRSELEKNKIKLVSKIEENVVCKFDKQRIEQVFNNLIVNAIDFCPKSEGKITVDVFSEKNYIKIVVADNGSGIKQEELDKVFDQFYQVDSTIVRTYGGTGLGLFICKGIIKLHYGKIWIESKIGNGTKVNIILPKKSVKQSKNYMNKIIEQEI